VLARVFCRHRARGDDNIVEFAKRFDDILAGQRTRISTRKVMSQHISFRKTRRDFV
jgi:hypothetical protein